ncbi:unannotated protein [freshwater metagenome]|uniref:Unannotated protein n=1 Tax=freshwater metagenome TaxID=449393 RepID=A0A6J7PXE7_9ZZZZ
MPRSLRHRSTRAGSGPASTTTAESASIRSTMASPWPTSHMTATHPVGGQCSLPARGSATPHTTTPATTAADTGRGTRDTARRTGPRYFTVRAPEASSIRASAAPRAPVGQGMRSGAVAATPCATHATHWAQRTAGTATAWASAGLTADARVAATPSRVAGATANSARRLAGTAPNPTEAPISTSTGAVTSCADTVIDSASASERGSHGARAAIPSRS